MKSNICKLNEDLTCLGTVLAEVEKVTKYNGLEDKKALRLRLLAEELCGMLPGLIENFSGKFWAENDGEAYELHVELKADDMNMDLRDELISRGFDAEVKRDIYDVPSRVCWQADIDKLQAEYDLIIFNVNASFVAEWSEAHMLIWASHLFDKKKKLIVNFRSPFFAVDYFPEDPTIIEMNCAPIKETMEMLVDGILGKLEFTGKSLITRQSER